MREIKFRAWDKPTQKMLYWEYLLSIHASLQRFFNEPDVEVMQFTGLLDKQGQEIYEGDIVRYQLNSAGIESNKTFATSTVIFARGAFVCHHNTRVDIWGLGYICSEDGQLGQVEIIGNIYENKELLG